MKRHLKHKDDPSNQPIATVVSKYIPMLPEDPMNFEDHPELLIQHVESVMIQAVKQINECLFQFQEARHLEIQFKNILERDDNPTGANGMFLVVNHFDFSGVNASREGNTENYQPRRVVL